MRALHIIAKSVFGLAVCLLVMLLLAVNVGLIWVATGPRDLNRFIPMVEKTVAEANIGYTVKIESSQLSWNGWRNPFDIRLQDVRMYTAEGVYFAQFPEVSLGLDVLSLLSRNLVPTSIEVRHPTISLYQDETGHISFGQKKDSGEPAQLVVSGPDSVAPYMLLIEALKNPSNVPLFRKLRNVAVTDASVSLGNSKDGLILSSNKTTVNVRVHRRTLFADVLMHIPQDKQLSKLFVRLESDMKNDAVVAEVQMSNLSPHIFSKVTPELAPLEGLHLPVSGKFSVGTNAEGRVVLVLGKLSAKAGIIKHDMLEGEAHVQNLLLQVSTIGDDALEIEALQGVVEGARVNATGQILRNKEGKFGLALKATVENADAKKVRLFWPKALAPMSRDWVIENVTEGQVPLVQFEANISPEAMAMEQLPPESLHAVFHATGATIHYKEGFPPITQAEAEIKVNALALHINAKSGKVMNNTNITAGTLDIADLIVDNPRIEAEFSFTSNASDVAKILSNPQLEVAQLLNIQPDKVSGKTEGKAKVGFDYHAPRDAKGNIDKDKMLDYAVVGTVSDFVLPDFNKQFDIKAANGKIELNNLKLNYEGTAEVNGAKAKIALLYNFPESEKILLSATAEAQTAASNLVRFGLPEDVAKHIGGNVSANVTTRVEQNGAEFTDIAADLTQASIDVPELQWSKPVQQSATLKASLNRHAGVTQITDFNFTTKEANAKGNLSVNKAGELEAITFDPILLGRTDAKVVYAPIQGGVKFYASGKSLDITPLIHKKEGQEPDFSFKNFPALDLNMNIPTLYVGPEIYFSNVRGTANCSIARCESVNMKGETSDGKAFNATLARESKSRVLRMNAENAGEFLRGLDIYDNMQGGTLLLEGSFQDAKASAPFTGSMVIKEYELKKAPVLAKLLTLASLTGALDTLAGRGIQFRKLQVPFTLENDVITIKGGKASGNALGITVEGNITFPKMTLALEGAVVPSYTLNTILSDVPIIGDIVTGIDGEGIFAARYTARGPASDPDISTNPLSMLTPGFLRDLFDGMTPPAAEKPKAN